MTSNNQADINYLAQKAKQLRRLSLEMIYRRRRHGEA
jgi:hypothetical protein